MDPKVNRRELLTFGYVRNMQNSMDDTVIIPDAITRLCLQYCTLTMIYFTTSYAFNDNRKIITDEIEGSQQLRAGIHVDGNILFYSKDPFLRNESNNIYEWHFKCYNSHGNDKIGIISTIDKVDSESMIYRDVVFGDTFFWWNANNVWKGGKQLPIKKTETWKNKDIISVKLDVINWTLEYAKNNKKMFDQSISLDVNENAKFYACITFGNQYSKYDNVFEPYDAI
eukprot:158404_1